MNTEDDDVVDDYQHDDIHLMEQRSPSEDKPPQEQ